MARSRSPQYPRIGLSEAIDKARMVWERDYQNALPREVIAEHMGYKGLNGKSLGLIAAVSRYGLFEGRGDQTKVTDLAVKILAHETGDEARTNAVLAAARSPSLFHEISERFHGNSPSDQALRSYLLTRGFTIRGAEGVIHSFRETEEFVASEKKALASTTEEIENPVDQQSVSYPVETTEKPDTSMPSPGSSGVPTISMSDEGLIMSAGVITSMSEFDRLMKRLHAGKALLEDEESDY